MDDDDLDDGSDTSERTALSASDDDVVDNLADRHLQNQSLSESREESVSHIHVEASLAIVWQFLLSRPASEFRRFTTTDFVPAETVSYIAHGTSYVVSKSRTSSGEGQLVVIKRIIGEHDGVPAHNTIETVLRELRVFAHKPIRNNPNVAGLIGYGTEETGNHLSMYLVANFAPGGTLKDYLAEQATDESTVFLERAHFSYEIAGGLAGLHACGIVHGDIKLANTLLFADTKKNGLVAKLSDFGCAMYEDHHSYIGSKIYTAPEIRRWNLVDTESVQDFYACDIFALGLLVWETLQGGKPFINLEHQDDVIVRLNALQRDDLLLKALQCFEDLPIQGPFPRRVIRNVFEGSLRDNPAKRINCKAIVSIFKSDSVFSKSGRRTGFCFEPSKIPPLQNWSYHRTDNLARSVPYPLQIELFKRADSNLRSVSAATVASAYFDIAICHITGFGTGVSIEKFLDSLNKAAIRGEPHASGMLSRVHAALQIPLVTTVMVDRSIMQVEHDLQRLPNDLYYSHRIRRHEQVLQSALLDSTFDIFSGSSLLIRAGKFTQEETVNELLKILGDSSMDPLTLIAVNELVKMEKVTQVFHLAARLGLIGIIRSFLEAGVDVNARDEYRATPLIAACRGGQMEIVRLLLNYGADSWKRQRNGISPFHWLMMFNDQEVYPVLEILTKTHNSMVMDAVVAEPLEMLQHGLQLKWSPVHFAVTVRNSVVMKTLIEAGASMKSGDVTPLDMAVANHCPEIVHMLLTYTLPSWQRTPFLHLGDVSTLKLMLLHGDQRHENLQQTALNVLQSPYGDVNQKDEDGYCSLAEAARESPCDVDLAVLECLISHGARCDIEVPKLMYCLLARNDRRAGGILDLLIERGAVDVTRGLLTKAISCGNRNILDSVLRTGIDVNEKDDDGLYPLVCAVLFPKSAHAVKALISRGADANAVFESSKRSSQMSAFMMCLALPEGDGEMIDAFIEGGAPLVDAKGESIVHRVCQIPARVNGFHVLAHLFRNHPQTKSFISQTSGEMFGPIHNACFVGNLDAVLILLENGAEVDISEDFNPIAMTERLALHPEERYVPFERGAFRLDRWKRTAEAVLVELLDRSDPGHGRSMLHFATRVCNYDRVVELVERGAQPWTGDAKKITPMGMLPTEVLEYDEEQTDTPPEDYIREGLKIKEYLSVQMVLRASQIDSFDAIDDAPAPIAPETDSPFQLETHYENKVNQLTTASGYDHMETLEARFRLSESYMMQERWAEAEMLQTLILEKPNSAAHMGSFGLGEIRSDLVRVLIALNKLEEAADHANISLMEATRELPSYTKPPEGQVAEVAEAVHNGLFDEMDRNRYFDIFCNNGDMRLALALFNHSLVIEAQGDSLGALRLKEIVIDVVREKSSDKEPHLRIMAGYLIRNYCTLERWDDVQKNLTWCLAMLEFAAAEHFPVIQSNLLHVAGQFALRERWAQAADIYQRIHDCAVQSRGEKSFYSTNALRLLAALFQMQEKYREALDVQSKRVDACKQLHGVHSIETQYEVLELAQIYGKQERHVECAILQRQVIDEFEILGPVGQEHLLKVKRALTKTLVTRKKFHEAEGIANAVLTGFTAVHGATAQCTLDAMSALAQVLNYQDRCDEAIVLYKDVLEKQEESHGRVHQWTLKALTDLLPVYLRANLMEQAKSVSTRAIDICRELHGPESMETLTVLYFSSGVHSQAGEIEQSRDVKAQVLELERKIRPIANKGILFTMTELANDHFLLKEFNEAIALQIEALEGYQRLENRSEVKIIETIYSLACSYHEAGRLQDARTRYEEAIANSRSLLGDQDERTIEKLSALMVLYTEMDEYELAKDPAYESLWFMEKNHGDDHPSTQQAREDVVIIMKSLDEWKEAGRQAKKLVISLEKTKGDKDEATIKVKRNLADCYVELNDFKGAEPLYRRVLEHYLKHLPPTDKGTLQVIASLVSTLKDLEKYPEALELNEELLKVYTDTLGVDDETTLATTVTKANILYFQERYSEALILELQIISIRIASFGAGDSKTLDAKESASKTYLALQKYEEAITYAEEVLGIRESLEIADEDDDMLDTIENLTEIYIAAERWQDAKSMADRGLKARRERADGEGNRDVISALKTLNTVARGMGDEKWTSEIASLVSLAPVSLNVTFHEISSSRTDSDAFTDDLLGKQISKEEAAKELRKSQWWRK